MTIGSVPTAFAFAAIGAGSADQPVMALAASYVLPHLPFCPSRSISCGCGHGKKCRRWSSFSALSPCWPSRDPCCCSPAGVTESPGSRQVREGGSQRLWWRTSRPLACSCLAPHSRRRVEASMALPAALSGAFSPWRARPSSSNPAAELGRRTLCPRQIRARASSQPAPIASSATPSTWASHCSPWVKRSPSRAGPPSRSCCAGLSRPSPGAPALRRNSSTAHLASARRLPAANQDDHPAPSLNLPATRRPSVRRA